MYFFILLQGVKILISNNKKSMYLPKVTTLEVFKLFKTEKSFIEYVINELHCKYFKRKNVTKIEKEL